MLLLANPGVLKRELPLNAPAMIHVLVSTIHAIVVSMSEYREDWKCWPLPLLQPRCFVQFVRKLERHLLLELLRHNRL